MEHVQASTLADLASEAREKCKNSTIHNLLLSCRFKYEETESEFTRSFDDIASQWQHPQVPNQLHINHGYHIHKHGDGIEYIANELKNKPDSNRACLSLIDMSTLIGSQDSPIPSFLLLQFGFFRNNHEEILITAYFRALEVANFLPINLAEICQIIRHLKSIFPNINYIHLNILAFVAHNIPRFPCLQKAAIDFEKPTRIGGEVSQGNVQKIQEWLDSKIGYEDSVICTDGLEHLLSAMKDFKDKYSTNIIGYLESALDTMKRLRAIRRSTSHSDEIKILNEQIRTALEKVKDLLYRGI